MGGAPTHVAPIIGLGAITRYMSNTKPMVSLGPPNGFRLTTCA